MNEISDKTDVKSILEMDKLVFDKLYFERKGFKNENELELNVQIEVGEVIDSEIYKVTVTMNGEKKDEYDFIVQITGFFSLEGVNDQTLKDVLLTQNAVAILMPYIRSQISLLTAQPDVDCVVLPPINIMELVKDI